MKFLFRNSLAGLGVSLLLAACGGGGSDGGGEGSTGGETVQKPVAQASIGSQPVWAGATVTLTGSGSSPRNGALTYQWQLLDRPQNSQAAIQASEAVSAQLATDLPGSYTAALIVNDGVANSDPAHVTVQALNPDPVAVIYPESLNAVQGQRVQLDASRSKAPDGQDASQLSYAWTLAAPAGSTAALDDSTIAQPRFLADVTGDYTLTLQVRHGDRVSQVASSKVVAVKRLAAPTARIKEVVKPLRGQTVTLDGSDSSDAEGLSLQYHWEVSYRAGALLSPVNNPSPSKVELKGADTSVASFVPDLAGNYEILFYVYNGVSKSETRSLFIKVEAPENEANRPPVAIITPGWAGTYEIMRNQTMFLSGYFDSYDPDGDALFYEWKFLEGPAGFDPQASVQEANGNVEEGATHRLARFVATHDGYYTFQLRVYDGQAWSAPVTQTYRVHNGANRKPTAVAEVSTGNNSVMVNSTVMLNGANSTDPDSNRMTYAWAVVARPNGSTAALSGADTATPTFRPDVPGPYSFTLVVTDVPTSGQPIPANRVRLDILAKAQNHAPFVRIASRDQYVGDQPFVLERNGAESKPYDDGSAALAYWNAFNMRADAFDPDGDPLTYLWAVVQEPKGASFGWPYLYLQTPFCDTKGKSGYSQAFEGMTYEAWANAGLQAREWTCPNMGLAPTMAGRYVVQLMVSDGVDIGGPVEIVVDAVSRANYPSLLLERLPELALDKVFEQVFFPRVDTARLSVRNLPFSAQNIGTYRLTAAGGDYTIRNLKAVSEDAGVNVRFEGLSNNQVIKKGDVVTFSVWQDEITAFNASGVSSVALDWSFSVAEKSGWTFQVHRGLDVRIR